MPIDADRAAESFAAANDFTVGLEEEFALLSADALDLVPRFEELGGGGVGVAGRGPPRPRRGLGGAARGGGGGGPAALRGHRGRAHLERDRDPLRPRRRLRRRARPPARGAPAPVRARRLPRG